MTAVRLAVRNQVVAGRPPAPGGFAALTHLRALRDESGQAIVLLLGLAAVLIVGTLILAGFGHGLTGKGRHQRAADLASISAAHAMTDAYHRLLVPAYRRRGVPNPRHLDPGEYEDLARAAAIRTARRNGFRLQPEDVRFAGEDAFGPLQVTTIVRGDQAIRLGERGGDAPASVAVSGRATAEMTPVVTADLSGAGGEFACAGCPSNEPQGKPAFD